jgi:formylglycine-generating enzyme required for sulfatase activity
VKTFNQALLVAFGLLLSTSVFAFFDELPSEMQDHVFSFLTKKKDLGIASQVSRKFNEVFENDRRIKGEGRKELLQSWPRFFEFDAQFVKIPRVTLPASDEYPGGLSVFPFETSRYPVTRQIWVDIMGEESLDPYLKEHWNWKECPDCPITIVAWENEDGSPAEIQEFLKRVNFKTAKLGCTYDLPTDPQLWATIRGDISGENRDPYSAGVTEANVDDYLTHEGNSNTDGIGPKIQPIGRKKLNSFGIELGNIWKMSKDIYDSVHPNWGRSKRGGGWFDSKVNMRSDNRSGLSFPGVRYTHVGFTLVRKCK